VKVLIWAWPKIDSAVAGGHQSQVRDLHHALLQAGVDATISFGPEPSVSAFDVVHGFGLSAAEVRQLRTAGVAVALTPIYTPWRLATHNVGQWTLRRARAATRMAGVLAGAALRRRHHETAAALIARQRELALSLEGADLLIPNSAAELETVRRELAVSTPAHVVPNIVDVGRFPLQRGWSECSSGAPRRHVAYVGRFEPQKNQLGLIKALRRSNYPLLLVGPVHPEHAPYLEACRRAMKPADEILGPVARDSLTAVYRRARVHVLPSWSETTGLVSMEAALSGCNVVTTANGYTRDYFGDLAWYCDPHSRSSIRDAVERAYETAWSPRLAQHILERFSPAVTASEAKEAYRTALRLVSARS
jgi:glycosyltransferase involved in cell wall biosynthesis